MHFEIKVFHVPNPWMIQQQGMHPFKIENRSVAGSSLIYSLFCFGITD